MPGSPDSRKLPPSAPLANMSNRNLRGARFKPLPLSAEPVIDASSGGNRGSTTLGSRSMEGLDPNPQPSQRPRLVSPETLDSNETGGVAASGVVASSRPAENSWSTTKQDWASRNASVEIDLTHPKVAPQEVIDVDSDSEDDRKIAAEEVVNIDSDQDQEETLKNDVDHDDEYEKNYSQLMNQGLVETVVAASNANNQGHASLWIPDGILKNRLGVVKLYIMDPPEEILKMPTA